MERTARSRRWVTDEEALRAKYRGRVEWWYVVDKTTFPWTYFNETRRDGSVGSFWGYASKYRTREDAEMSAVMLAAKFPELIGKLSAHER